MKDTSIRSYLERHPKAIGVLFLLGLLAVHPPVAAWTTFNHGP